ncbi:hypothetical protein ACFS4T_02470 [Pseudomonas lini]
MKAGASSGSSKGHAPVGAAEGCDLFDLKKIKNQKDRSLRQLLLEGFVCSTKKSAFNGAFFHGANEASFY